MCGIAGLLALDGSEVDPAPVGGMLDALRHRGPDDAGTWSEGPVVLGNRRLSIIDIAGGHQPIASEDGSIVVIQNGELYNHVALREELQAAGHRFASRSDTEVLVHGYEEWGAERLLERLRGMFAIAIWDGRHRRLLLARDRFGIKPLYWTAQGGRLAFASELKALRRAGLREEIDLDALEAYLAFNAIPAPLTIFRDIAKLAPGHLLTAQAGGEPELREWCRPLPVPADAVRRDSEADLARELRDRLRDSVRAHLVADVPVGVFLSGGVDSGALTALAAEETAGRISTFSIGFEEESFDELGLARQVAERYGTDHHELVLKVGGDRVVTLLPEIVAAFDEPFADSSALPTYLVSQLAAEHVKVALSGEGGDELFGGYHTYVAGMLAPRLAPLARIARPLVERLPSSSRRVSLDYKARRFVRAAHLPPLERHHGFKEILAPELRAELLDRMRTRTPADPLEPWREHWSRTAGAEELARLQELDLNLYLPSDLLVKTDRASMAHSLEARVPFLDAHVAELALSLPTAMKVRGRKKKLLLRRAVEPLLPRAVVHGAKRGFSIPAAAWLRGELEPFAREVLHGAELVDRDVALGLLDAHVARRDDHSRPLWGLLSLELWRAQA
ncbi:MAG: asparagine synthase (glutamine-hydrolyzing) [Solirubrobacteraceae bacterium]